MTGDEEEADDLALVDVAPRARSSLVYLYDFGDEWRHDVVVEKVLPPDPELRHPVCVDGARADPPEDVGGPGGYHALLEARANPRRARGYARERLMIAPKSWKPEVWDRDAVNRSLAGTWEWLAREREPPREEGGAGSDDGAGE